MNKLKIEKIFDILKIRDHELLRFGKTKKEKIEKINKNNYSKKEIENFLIDCRGV